MTTYRQQPFDAERLTDPELAAQQSQEKRTCTTCSNAQIHQRGGARQCVEPGAPDPVDVMAGRTICIFWN